jgi:hypothetical protein
MKKSINKPIIPLPKSPLEDKDDLSHELTEALAEENKKLKEFVDTSDDTDYDKEVPDEKPV